MILLILIAILKGTTRNRIWAAATIDQVFINHVHCLVIYDNKHKKDTLLMVNVLMFCTKNFLQVETID